MLDAHAGDWLVPGSNLTRRDCGWTLLRSPLPGRNSLPVLLGFPRWSSFNWITISAVEINFHLISVFVFFSLFLLLKNLNCFSILNYQPIFLNYITSSLFTQFSLPGLLLSLFNNKFPHIFWRYVTRIRYFFNFIS